MWPGNAADVTTLIPVIDRLRRRFDIARVRGSRQLEEEQRLTASSCCVPTPISARSRPCSATSSFRRWSRPSFRTAKHLLSTLPILHKLDETIRGHVFAASSRWSCRRRRRIASPRRPPRLLAGDHRRPDSLTEIEIGHDGKRFVVRSAPRSAASLAPRAAGVAVPPDATIVS